MQYAAGELRRPEKGNSIDIAVTFYPGEAQLPQGDLVLPVFKGLARNLINKVRLNTSENYFKSAIYSPLRYPNPRAALPIAPRY
jgi:hypothetical protein